MEKEKIPQEESKSGKEPKPELCLIESCLKLYPSNIKIGEDSLITDARSAFLISSDLLPNRAVPAINVTAHVLKADVEARRFTDSKVVLCQEIKIDYLDITYGTRFYFFCPSCGTRRKVLYLKPGGLKFACMKCLNLTYELTTIHRGRFLNELRYYFNRRSKLNLINAGKVKISYAGKFTKRASRIMGLSNKITSHAESLQFS